MRLIFVLLLSVPLILIARENPFEPASNNATTASKQQTILEQTSKPISKPKIHAQRTQTKSTTASQSIKPTIHPQRKSYKKEVINYGKARFVFRENSAYIETKDKVIRHFAISNPPSIVIDFKSPSDFASKR
ncbi:MAG: hypothetical protein WBF77_01135, partial [Sulfurimonadaceae bacterium]